MNRIIKGLLAATLFASCAVNAANMQSGSTFIAHRDELANLGMNWSNSNHLAVKKECATKATDVKTKDKAVVKKVNAPFGASLDVTGFYSETRNPADLARLFGMGTTGAITVTAGVATTTTLDDALYGTDIHHAPNADGTSLNVKANLVDAAKDSVAYDRVAMNGTVKLAPKRQAYGAHLGWKQSLDGLLKGLSFSVRAPIVQVRTNMNATTPGAVASSLPPHDGKTGATLLDYFGGKLATDIATYKHVSQNKMTKDVIDNTYCKKSGVADIEVALQYAFDCCTVPSLSWGLGATAQIPTGNEVTMSRMFEPILGARRHVAAGANGFAHFDAYSDKHVSVAFDLMVDWKYFFKGTEKRTMGIYDLDNKVMLPASQYRLLMQNGVTGVTPAANILTVDHTVTPGHQVQGLAGMCVEWNNFTFDLGYNVYWHQAEKVVQKAAWANDTYAIAHPHYSMQTSALGYDLVGGGSYIVDAADGRINHNGYVNRLAGDIDDAYNDTRSSVTKHSYAIGSNGDSGGTPNIIDESKTDGVNLGTNVYPGAYTSINGPIQAAGKTTSALNITTVTTTTGVNVAGNTPLTVHYNVSSAPAITAMQITHSVVGGVSYKIPGQYPMVVGLGGQGEFQPTSRNSALEGFKVWAKFGISF